MNAIRRLARANVTARIPEVVTPATLPSVTITA
jgi:hypothetical protein